MDYSKFEGHTPGPWKIGPHDNVTNRFGDRIAVIVYRDVNGDETQANAALAAAAPDLLEENKRLRKALELCRDVLSNTPSAYHENSKLHSIFDMLCDLNEQK